MRGYRSTKLRAGYQLPPIQQPQAQPTQIPAPLGGWNARDPLAAMKPIDAVVMDNFYPSTSTVDMRPGREAWATGMTGNVKSLLAYNSGTVSALFAVAGTNFYDVTLKAAVGAAVTTCTNAKWEYRNMTTSGGSYLIAVNGVDKLKAYTGAAWVNIDNASVPAITGVTTTTLSNVHLFKRRLWFCQVGTLDAWYLPIDSFGGAAVKFPLGPIFGKGGYLVAMESWTIDGGNGADDFLCMVTSQGEMAVYAGTDPSTALAWGLVGVYDIGIPIGKRCFKKYGGDLLFLSQRGLFPLSQSLLSATLDRQQALSNKISGAFEASIQASKGVYGWDIVIEPTYDAVSINVPMVEGSLSVQYVMNNTTKSWCRFTGWSADVFEEFGSNVYSGLGTTIYRNWVGNDDSGAAIQARCQQAYFSVGAFEQGIQLVRPNLAVQGNLTISCAIDTDFNLFSSIPADESLLYIMSGSSLWDTGRWDSAVWSSGPTALGGQWMTVTNNPGFFHSFRLQCTSSSSTVNWVSTYYTLQKAGIL